ncbi:MAG: hypothetical protein COT35_06190 [Nitrospirae bacterium CG08_land_8_20_14_0_20_52_24]|nr:MAG: hypothetical protein COT35_06190 [Nitrospirae bacterium CG08_land_8_20_14_0_20_52_24]
MGLRAKLLKNTSYLTAGSQIGNLFQFLFFLYFARQLGGEAVGQYSFAFSFTFLFSVLADLGLSGYLIREVARDRSGNRRIFARCLSLRLIFIMVSLLLAAGTILIFVNEFSEQTVRIIVLLGLYHIFFSIADVFLAEFKGHDRMGLVALLNILLRFVISSAGIILLWLRFDFLSVLICFPVGSFIYLIISIYLSFYYFRGMRLQFQDLDLKGLFMQVLPFTFTVIFMETLYHQDILLLKFLKDDRAVGFYAVANNIVLALMGVLMIVHTALLPTFSRLYVDSQSKLVDVSRQSLRYLLLTGLPMATGLYAISDKIIVFLFSEAFVDSVDALKILCWAIAVGFAAATYSVLLTAINRQKEKVIAVGVCLAFNLALNLVLVPKLSFLGASVAKLMTETLHFIFMAYLASKFLTPIPIGRILIKPALSCVLMYAFIQYIYEWNLLYLIPLSALVYVLVLGVIQGYSKEEIQFVKRFYSIMFLNRGILKTYGSKKE